MTKDIPDEIDNDSLTLVTIAADQGLRLDKVMANHFPDFSRTRLKNLIEDGYVFLDDTAITDSSFKVIADMHLTFTAPVPVDDTPTPENIPLDILYEDADLIVINKSADMVVHPAAGHSGGTLVNAILYHCGDTLSGIGGVKRPGIVHRLDRGTSGAMVVAKNDTAHLRLQAQLSDRTMGRTYHAVTFKTPIPPIGRIDAPIGRHKINRLKMTIGGADAREAATNYTVRARAKNESAARVECRLESGRTHQIRVHLASIGYPLIGDPLYGPQDTAVRAALKQAGFLEDPITAVLNFNRQALHAAELHFMHPKTGENMSFSAEEPDDFKNLTHILGI
jgi:23S rRNA pseudouridine1911/1915/1917 synthase